MKIFDILLLASRNFLKNYPFSIENLCSFFTRGTLENFRLHIVPSKVKYYGSAPLHKGKPNHLHAEEITLAHVRVSILGIKPPAEG